MTPDDIRRDVGFILERLESPREVARGRWKAKCPLHDDSTPSFDVKLVKGIPRWYCSPCGRSGGVIDLVMAVDGTSYPETMKRLGAEKKEDWAPKSNEQRMNEMRWAPPDHMNAYCNCSGPPAGFTRGVSFYDPAACGRCLRLPTRWARNMRRLKLEAMDKALRVALAEVEITGDGSALLEAKAAIDADDADFLRRSR